MGGKRYAGPRTGTVQLISNIGNILATTPLYGFGLGPQIAFGQAIQSTVGNGLTEQTGVAVDAAGDVFIASQANGAVMEIMPNRSKV